MQNPDPNPNPNVTSKPRRRKPKRTKALVMLTYYDAETKRYVNRYAHEFCVNDNLQIIDRDEADPARRIVCPLMAVDRFRIANA